MNKNLRLFFFFWPYRPTLTRSLRYFNSKLPFSGRTEPGTTQTDEATDEVEKHFKKEVLKTNFKTLHV